MGRFESRVSYYAQDDHASIFFTQSGLMINLIAPDVVAESGAGSRWALALDFLNANPSVSVLGQTPLQGTVSYFNGVSDQWVSGAPTYSGVTYGNLWNGIDLTYAATANGMKYLFTVSPGSAPTNIQLAYRGASAVALTSAGAIQVSTPVRSYYRSRALRIPRCWRNAARSTC